MRNLKVVDFTHGKRDSDDVNTSLPFTENFKECRTIQQANVVIGAYVNQNYKDMQNKQDKLVSGETIKTINNESILGFGNIEVQAESPSWGNITGYLPDQTDLKNALDNKLTAYDDGLSTTVDEFVKFSGGLSVPASGESAFGKAPMIFADPVNGNDATRKSYVDNQIQLNKNDLGVNLFNALNSLERLNYNSTYTINSSDNITVNSTGIWGQLKLVFPTVIGKRYRLICDYSGNKTSNVRLEIVDGYNTATGTYAEVKRSVSSGKFGIEFIAKTDKTALGFYTSTNVGETVVSGTFSNIRWYEVQEITSFNTYEEVIGYWTDGKPLYRKVLSYNHIGGDTLDYIDITSLNVDKVPRLESSFYPNNSEVVPAPFTNTTGYHFRNYIGGNKGTLTYEVSQLYPSGLVETILEYTKTTDTGVSLLSLDEEE